MDDLTRAFHEQALKLFFYMKRGEEFQNFFASVMEARYPNDFTRTIPWGNVGDRKNDGYLRSKRMLFQVYAPNEMTANKAVGKIKEDFQGALPHWRAYFKTWVFVHNCIDGLGPDILSTLLALDSSHRGLTVRWWGHPEIRTEIFRLEDRDIALILGHVPTARDMLDVGYQDLKLVLDTIAIAPEAREQDIRPFPATKLKANALSEDVGNLLAHGRKKSHLVGTFFKDYHDPTYGDRMAEAFTRKYQLLRAANVGPDDIFTELLAFGGGSKRQSARYEAALLAIVAYFFDVCDIFERPRIDGET